MKKVSLMLMFMIFVGFWSCRDTAKEAAEMEAAVEKIESVEQDLDEAVMEVEDKVKEVEEALSELDSI